MAITYVGKGAFASSTGSISVTAPTGIANGDILLLAVFTGVIEGSLGTPSGWTQVTNAFIQIDDYNYSVFYKVSNGTQANVSVSVTDSGGNGLVGLMTAWRGVDTTTPINAFTTNTDTGTTFVAVNPTSTLANCMLINLIGFGDYGASDTDNYTSWVNTSLVSITEGHDQLDARDNGLAFAYGIKTTAGAINNTTATADATGNGTRTINVLLAPSPESMGNFFQFI